MTLRYEQRYGPAEISRRISDIGRRIVADYGSTPEDPIVLIAVLKGSSFLIADLARAIDRPARLEYIDVIRGDDDAIVDFHFLTKFDVKGRDIIILKDVIRSGIIEGYLMDQLREENPRSIRFACLVDRPQERKISLLADYVLFPSEEGMLVGYGMAYRGEGGNLPFIAQLSPQDLKEPFDPPTGVFRRKPNAEG